MDKVVEKKAPKKKKDYSKLLVFIQKYAMIIVLVLTIILFSILTPVIKGIPFITPDNINNLIAQNGYVFILATGMLLCILTGGNIDLSVGSVVCFVGAVGAKFLVFAERAELNMTLTVFIAVVIMLLVGTAIGAMQAFWIAYVRIPPFIVTLAGMLLFRGLGNAVLKSQTALINNPLYSKLFGGGAACYIPDFIGNTIEKATGKEVPIDIVCVFAGIIAIAIFIFFEVSNRIKRKKKNYEVSKMFPWIFKMVVLSLVIGAITFFLALCKGVPSMLVIVMIIIIVYSYITSNTTEGRYFYAIGGNEKATKLSGINTNRTLFLAYTNMGFLAAVAAIVIVARANGASPSSGINFEMDAISSCFVGGASAYGGIGTVSGSIIGAALMGVINQGMSILGTSQDSQKIIKGLVLLLAVIFDVVSKRGFKLLAKNDNR